MSLTRKSGLTMMMGSLILSWFGLLFANAVVLAQGGTGKPTANVNSSKTGTSTNKNKGKTAKRGSSNERAYVPTGPTAKDMIFLRDFLKSDGAFEGGVKYSFSPVGRCQASMTVNGPTGALGNRRFRTYTFSFSDIDARRIRAELFTTAGGYFDSVHLASTDDRKVIEEKSRLLFDSSDKDESSRLTDKFSFSFKDSKSGENQGKVIKALKNLIEICSAESQSSSRSTNPFTSTADPVSSPPDGRNLQASDPKSQTPADTPGEKVYTVQEVDQRAVVTAKPSPLYTEEARKNLVTGTVKLRAVLAASGEVRNITVIQGLPDGLTERAIAAARQLKFTPAEKNGQPVSQYVTLEYTFNPY